jgi:hypothetical protein
LPRLLLLFLLFLLLIFLLLYDYSSDCSYSVTPPRRGSL